VIQIRTEDFDPLQPRLDFIAIHNSPIGILIEERGVNNDGVNIRESLNENTYVICPERRNSNGVRRDGAPLRRHTCRSFNEFFLVRHDKSVVDLLWRKANHLKRFIYQTGGNKSLLRRLTFRDRDVAQNAG
jgi:hypothetical protein